MAIELEKVISILNKWVPIELAEDWDNVGLQIMPKKQNLKKIMICLDPSQKVLEQAIKAGADMVLSHHPLIFKPIKKIVKEDPVSSLVYSFIENGMGLFVMHTNFDQKILTTKIAKRMNFKKWSYFAGGQNRDLFKLVVFVPKGHEEKVREALTDMEVDPLGKYSHCSFYSSGTGTFMPLEGSKPFIGDPHSLERVDEVRLETIISKENLSTALSAMKIVHPYEEVAYDIYPLLNKKKTGFGILGETHSPYKANDLFNFLKTIFPCQHLKASNWEIGDIQRIALVPGKGGKFLQEAHRNKADVFISGDFDYHQYRQAEDLGLSLIDLGHYPLEIISKDIMVASLTKLLDNSLTLEVAEEQPESSEICL